MRFKIEQKIGRKILAAQREYNEMQKSIIDQSQLKSFSLQKKSYK